MAALAGMGPWAWLIAGLVLVGLETLAPGVFLIWFGIAAILTAVADWIFALSWQGGLLVFAGLSVASVLAGRALTRRACDTPDAAAPLNRRAQSLVGRVFRLDRPILAGEGRIRVDDSVWRVLGPDLEAGASVRVTGVDGATLRVEPAPASPA